MAEQWQGVPFYDAPTSTLLARYYPQQIGQPSTSSGCSCRPLWWLLVAGVAGVALGAGIQHYERSNRKGRRRAA